jgi:hypothetical protein
METSMDYVTHELLILFEPGENPLDNVPAGWEIIEREEPEYFRGMLNPGRVVCKPLTK